MEMGKVDEYAAFGRIMPPNMVKTKVCSENCPYFLEGVCSLSAGNAKCKCPGENGAIVKAMREYDRKYKGAGKADGYDNIAGGWR